MHDIRSLDFEIIKEPWNKYQISDGSVLKTRTILTTVERVLKDNKPNFKARSQTLTVINLDPSLKGTPTPRTYTMNEISESIEKRDMRYDTLSQEFNEYVLDDGTKIKIYTNVTNIDRSRLRNADGDLIYNIKSSTQIELKMSKQYDEPGHGI